MNDLYGANATIPEYPPTISREPATGLETIPEVIPSIPPCIMLAYSYLQDQTIS